MSTLTADQEQKLKPFMDEFPWLLELIENNSVEDVISKLETIQTVKILDQQPIPNDNDRDIIAHMVNLYGNSIHWSCVKAFTYGKIQGIRSERARRRKSNGIV